MIPPYHKSYYPLIPEEVTPSTKYFWALKNKIIAGKSEMSDMANT